MSIVTVIAILYISCYYGECQEMLLPPGIQPRWGACAPRVTFLNCDSTPDRPLILYNTLSTVLEVDIEKGCETSNLHYYWTLKTKDKEIIHTFPDRRQRRNVMIEKYQLDPGDYIVTSHVRESSPFSADAWIERKCFIRMTSRCPVPGIFGAEHKSAPIGAEIILDTSYSYTCNLKVVYSWECKSTGDYPQCHALNGQVGPKKRLVVQGYVGDFYWITVKAKAPNVPVQTSTQIINVTESESPIINMKCMKNCLDTGAIFSNPNIPVYIKSFCISECDKIHRTEWDLEAVTETKYTAEEIKKNGTYYGLNRPIFILKPGWIQYDESFELTINAYDKENRRLARNMVHINMTSDVGGKSNCTATHNDIIGMDRIYTIKCSVPPHRRPAMYKLQQWVSDPHTNELLALTLMYSNEPVFNVRLASQANNTMQNLTFIVVDDTMIMTNTTFQVEVSDVFPHASLFQLHQLMIYEYQGGRNRMSIPTMLEVGRIYEAAQIMNIIFCAARRFDMTIPGILQMRLTSQINFMRAVLQTERLLHPDLEYLLTLVPHLMVKNTKHLYHSKLRSRLCLTIASGIKRAFHIENYPLTKQSYLELLTIPLHKCANYYLDDDYERPQPFNIPLPPPIPEHIGFIDDYPNYGESLDEFSIEDLKEIVTNAIRTINEISEAYADTYIVGEARTYINYTANTSIDVNQGYQKWRRRFSDDYINLVLPDDLGVPPGEDVRIVYTTLPVAAFFWDSTSGKMGDHVIELNLYHGDDTSTHETVVKIPKKINIYFKLNTRQNVVIRTSYIEMPLEDVEWTEEYVTKHMKIFRVEVPQHHTLMSTVDEFSTVNNLMLAITKNRKPSKSDFTIERRQRDEQIFLYNRSEIDTWYYIGILPREEEIKGMVTKRMMDVPSYDYRVNDDYTISMDRYKDPKVNISFKLCFASLTCKEWTGSEWEIQNCDVGPKTTANQLHCICSRVKTLAADAKQVTVKEEDVLVVGYELVTTVNLIIPIITAVIIALYCILITFVYFRKKPMSLYFLSDNVEEDRYAYLVIAATSPYSDSSTTSNVVIKLYGTKSDSKPHVLNYPDPNMRIMQDGREDWFILTSSYHLGDLISIQVWYDGIGPRYTWYANFIKIYDLQTEEHWFFPLDKRFNLTKENMYCFTFYPSSEEENWVSKRKLSAYLRYYWNADNVWNIFNKKCDHLLLFIERMTILLGQILSTFAIALGVIALPTFRLKDGLGDDMFYSFDYVFWRSVFVAVVVFLIYCPFSLIFRYTPKRATNFKKDAVIFSARFYNAVWLILTGMVCISIGYLIWFGFWISYITSMLIVAVSIFAILINAILLENFKLVGYKCISSYRIKRFRRRYTLNLKAVIEEAAKQRIFLYNKLGKYALRPYLTHLYRPLSNVEYEKLRAEKKVEHGITKNVQEMAFFYLYTSMLFFLLLIKLSTFTYINSTHVAYMALNGSGHTRPTAYEVKNFDDLYDYFNNTLATMIHPMSWYGNWNVSESVLLEDYNTKLLGVVRIRQQRVHPRGCDVKFLAILANATLCYPEYSHIHRDRADVGMSKSMWAFQDAEETINYQRGEMLRYDGSGFIMNLGRNLNNTYYIIKLMKDNHWLDKRTRVVFVEFLTYNTNENLFSAVTLIFERTATMKMIVSHNIITLKLKHRAQYMEILSIIVFAVFCVLIFKLILKYLRKIIKYRMAAFFKLSNIWEIAIITTNVGIVFLYMTQYNENAHYFRKLRDAKNNAFVSYFAVMHGYEKAQTAMAILFAFAITRALGFMQFIEAFRVFQRTMHISYQSYLGVTVMGMLSIVGFAFSGHIMFGTYSHPFRGIQISAVSLLKRSVSLSKDFSSQILDNYNKQYGYAYCVLFSVWVLVLSNIFISTTILFHRLSRRQLRETQLEYTMKQYLKDKWSFYSEFWKRHLFHLRLKAGKESISTRPIATPKDHNIRYANCASMPTMKLRFITLIATAAVRRLLVRRWTDPPTETDYYLMKHLTATYLAEKKEPISKTLFFPAKNQQGHVRFVSNSKLLEMEYIVNHLIVRKGTTTRLKDTASLKKMREMESILKTCNKLLGNISVEKKKRKD